MGPPESPTGHPGNQEGRPRQLARRPLGHSPGTGERPAGDLSAALVAVVTRRRRPYRKNGEGLLARRAPAAPHPDPIALVIVSLLAAPSVANDPVAVADRTVAR